jgi:hypothetical protein
MDVLPVDYLYVGYLTIVLVTRKHSVEWPDGSEYWIGKDEEESGLACGAIRLRARETTNILSRDSWCPGADLNQVPPEWSQNRLRLSQLDATAVAVYSI